MNAKQMIERNKRIAEMEALLRTPLDPDLDYVDATASIAAIAEHVRGLHRLIEFLSTTIVAQGSSLIEARKKLIELEADMGAARIGPSERQSPSSLIGFDKPTLVS